MKLRSTLFQATCVSLFAIAVASPTQDHPDKPSEQEYKNIKVLKGVQAKEIVPAMQLMSASLGVGCDFCHVSSEKGEWPMEKDDKPEKDTARDMITMTRDLNAKYFDGRMEVTCATCHQGRSHPRSVPPIGAAVVHEQPPASGAQKDLPTAESLIDKYAAAVGGHAIDKLTSLHMKGTQVGVAGRQFPVESFAKAPDRSIDILTLPNGSFIQAFDGTTAWVQVQDGQVFPQKGQELEDAKRESDFYLNLKLKDQFKSFRRVRKDSIDGKDVYVVDTEGKYPNVRERLYFDSSTGLLVRRWIGKVTILGTLVHTEDFSDFREVAGVKLPYKIVIASPDGTNTLNFDLVEANVDIPDSRFARPAGKS